MGFSQIGIPYRREKRAAGQTKYSLWKLVRLARDGIFNFSVAPLHVIFVLGALTSVFALISIAFVLIQRAVGFTLFDNRPDDIPGYTSIILGVLFLSGMQLAALGVIGEYVGRLYEEVKGRPPYIVRRKLGFEDASKSEMERAPAKKATKQS